MESKKAIFETAQVGDFKLLKDLYSGSINQVKIRNVESFIDLSSLIVVKLMTELKQVFLLDRGIDIRKDRDGRTALHNFST